MAGGMALPGVGTEVLWTMIFSTVTVALFVLAMLYKVYYFYQPTVREPPRISYNNELCPICISPQVMAIETNCGHKFCGSCVRSYLRNLTPESVSLFTGRISCPLCRQEINLLEPHFTEDEIQSIDLASERARIETTVHRYNSRFGTGSRGLLYAIWESPDLIRHMFTDFFTMGGVVWIFRLRILLCFLFAMLYFGSPLDFIPEAMFGIFGLIDDMFIFLLCTVYATIIYRQFIMHRGLDE